MQIVCSHFNRPKYMREKLFRHVFVQLTLALRLLLKPEKFEVPFPIRARPPPKLLSYYTSDEHRGYLSPSYSMLYKEFVADMHKNGVHVSPNGEGRLE